MLNQFKNIKNLGLIMILGFVITFTSCDKVDLLSSESFAEASISKMQDGAFGKNFCLELIFPVGIQFVDGTTSEVSSYENLRETIISWFEENGVEKSKENKPQLIFPIQVVTEDGEVIDVASQDELRELRKECPRKGHCKIKGKRGFKCFSLVFPITVTIGGVDQTFDSREALKEAVKLYKEEVGDDAERPTLVFPITIVYEDETQVEIASLEALKEAKQACKDDN